MIHEKQHKYTVSYALTPESTQCCFAGGSDYFECHPPFECPHRSARWAVTCSSIKNGILKKGGWSVVKVVDNRHAARAPVQGAIKPYVPPGTISWEEHLLAHKEYRAKYGSDQSAQRIAERGGFSYGELLMFLGQPPTTWQPVEGI